MGNSNLIEIIKIPRIGDDASICFIEGMVHIPFEIKRVYYILNPVSGLPRGFHAHRNTNQVLFCLQGRVRLVVDNGRKREEIVLQNQPELGILLPPLLWHEMHDMDESTILVVFANQRYNPADYIRDYQEFISYTES